MAAVTACSGLVAAAAPPAFAEPVYEIEARWADNTPAEAASGDVVNAEWRVNVNDDEEAPSNEPVDNVNFTLTIENGTFEELPSSCLVDGVDPVSSISDDGKTMVCNIGTQDQGTAHVIQTPIRVDGETGAQLTGTGTIEGGSADLSPIEVVNQFGMDIRWSVATPRYDLQGYPANPTVDLDLQWTLSKDKRSEPGPQTVTYDLRITGAAESITVGGQRCTPFTTGAANGHPWSGGDHPAEAMVSPVDSCTIQQTGPNTFRLTLSGIDYEPAAPPTQDSTGGGLPVDQVALASGSIWLHIVPTSAGSITLQSSAPTYTSASGNATAQDDPANNSVTKTWFYPGTFTSPWNRGYTGSGGTNYDGSYVVSAGTRIQQSLVTGLAGMDRPDNLEVGMCAPIDTRYLTFQEMRPGSIVPGSVIEYFVGNHATVDPNNAGYNPQEFPECGGAAGWTTTPPADLSTVKAVRVTMTQGQLEAANLGSPNAGWFVESVVKDDVPVGQDIWNFMWTQGGGGWTNEGAGECATPTPGMRYPCTVGALRDVVRIVTATPYIEKTSDRAAVNPGRPAGFSLTYSANVPTRLPESVDDYQIVDTLPAGMTYVDGSADPAPVVTTNGSGQQVLTWTLDGVETNVEHALTYQAVADISVEPGSILQNSAVASVSGSTSRPATAQVTVSSNGYTSIGKSADKAFIPNLAGDGVGEGSWTVTLKSFDPIAQDFTDTIDILPYNGDGRGTDFAGDYTLEGVDAVAGATVYYTTEDPATLSDDPADDINGAPNAPSAIWSTTYTPDATAIRVIGPELAPAGTQQFTVRIATDGAEGEDVLVNRAQARDGHTELVMRTSAPIEVANYYSASLKKYVLDADGEPHDANTVEDYPTYRPGDTVPYRIVITNTGQGTLTNVVITDDRFPEGSFTIDELAPGDSETHEFEIILGPAGPDMVVNTACAEADIPEDSQVPPTINCDPAGMEVVGDPTHTKELVSATPIGNGQWEVVYGIEVTNESTASTSYSLDDTLHFTDEADIISAEVTSSPDGVTLTDPAWDGQDNLNIATGVLLPGNDDDGYAPHRYELTVIADVPLQVPGAGSDDDPTQCGEDGDDSDTAFNNTSEMTDARGETEEDQACAEIPSIDITKSVSEGPVPNGDGTWTVTYDIVAKNSGTADGEYDVTDKMTVDGDMVIDSGRVISAPDGVTPSADWTGLGADQTSPENVIATDVTLPAGESHTYQVEVVVSVDDADGDVVITPCSEDPSENGGLTNTAQIEHNDLTDDDSACVTVTYITVKKEVAEGPTSNGDGTWTVLYEVVAENVGPVAGEYDVYDQLRFGDGIEIVSKDVAGPSGVTVEDGWTGLGDDPEAAENLIASGVSLDAGGTHTYQVEVVVSLDEETIDPGTLVCPTPGSGEKGGLSNNTVLDHNGIKGTDEVCPTVPLIVMKKEISDGPTPNDDGTWTITYDLVVDNIGAAEGDYDLSDRLRYGAGIVVESAEITDGPDGVTPAAGWTGQGSDGADENVVATDIALRAGGQHTYQVEAVVSLDDSATPDTLKCQPGKPGGLANTGELIHNGESQDDGVCAPLPLIDITKSISGAVVPVDGEDGVYDATYEITVTNRGPGAGTYNLDDTLEPGKGVTVVGVEDVTTDAPDPVGINPGFDGVGDPRIVTGQPIAGAPAAAVVHTYTVVVRYAVDLSTVEVPDTAECTTGGGTIDGALHNVADVTWNGIKDSDDECVRPGKPTLDKSLVSAKPVGKGTWKVVYALTVGNVGTEPTTYDLDDELLFAPVVTAQDVKVTGPRGVTLNEGFNGETDQRIATGVRIAGLDDDGYAPHVYRVTVVAEVPLQFDQDEIGKDGTGSPACTVPPGRNLIEQGLNNAATLTDETGGKQTDTDCAELPSIDIAKSVIGDPVAGKDGAWTVTYAITAVNTGAAAGKYTLTDRLRFGAGIKVTAAAVTDAPKGVTAARSWTGQGAEGAAANVVATGVDLSARGKHTYRVQVRATVPGDSGDASTFTCPEPGSGKPGGFANTAGIGHNDLADAAEACATPNKPGDPGDPGDPGTPPPPPPLAMTGADLGWIVAGAALLILLGAAALIIAHQRRKSR